MADNSRLPPRWLLDELGLEEGVFNEDRTLIFGRPNRHNRAVPDVGNGPPARIPVPLTKRPHWEAIRKRLTDEGC